MEISLKVIKQKLQNNITKLKWKLDTITNSSLLQLSNLNEIRIIINEIEQMQLFGNLTELLKNSVIFTTSDDIMRVQAIEGQQIQVQLTNLKLLIENFLEVLKKTVPEENINSINIKLPQVNDFDELSKVSRDIHLGLTQILYNEDINGETKIVSVENGSIWLNVFVGSAIAVGIIGSLVWSSAVIYKKVLESKLLEEQIRGLKVKNDSIEDILKAQKIETSLMIQAEAEFINSEHFKVSVPENIEKIKNSITTFAELIGKGAEIHPALVAPESVSNLFPDPTKIIGLESKIKRLGNPSVN
jgi:hypothetical protein